MCGFGFFGFEGFDLGDFDLEGLDFGNFNPAFAPTIYESSDAPQAMPDQKGNTDGFVTSTLDIFDSGIIFDLNVELDVTHTADADLDVFLIGPDGTRARLFDDVGGEGDNFTATILNDDVIGFINGGVAPFSGSFRPEQGLGRFNSRSRQGTWTLEISDDTFSVPRRN